MPSKDLKKFLDFYFPKKTGPEAPQPPTVVFPERGFPPPIMAPTKIGDGFDNSALMQDPKFKQEDTMNQGMAVSEPYEEANEKAFEKNNPMNAISQETPVGDKVDEFLRKMGK